MEKPLVFAALVLVGVIAVVNGNIYTDEMRLFDNLTARTNPYVRPVLNISNPTPVKLGVALISLKEVDEKQNSMTSLVWLRMLWHNEHLSWDPKDFGGITYIRIPLEKIWTPDFALYSSADDKPIQFENTLSIVYSSGDVLLIPPAILTTICRVDLTYFPFDTQTCSMKIGSWTYNGLEVELSFYEGKEEIDLSDFQRSPEWDVTQSQAKVNFVYYTCCSEPYTDMTFNLTITRRKSVFSLVFVAPIAFLAILCPIIFLLPYSESQRFSLGGCFLICLALLLSNFELIVPLAHGTMPVLAQYYVSVVVLLALSLIFSAVITNLADRSKRLYPLPAVFKMIFIDGLGKVLCVSSESFKTPNDDGLIAEGSTGAREAADCATDWNAMATVLDRLFFIIYVILTMILSLVFLVQV